MSRIVNSFLKVVKSKTSDTKKMNNNCPWGYPRAFVYAFMFNVSYISYNKVTQKGR